MKTPFRAKGYTEEILDVEKAYAEDQKKLPSDATRIGRDRINDLQNFSLAPFTGEFNDATKNHLLNRALVGISHQHIDEVKNKSLSEIIDLLFSPESWSQPVNNYFHEISQSDYNNYFESEDVAPGEPFIERAYSTSNGEQFGGERNNAIESWFYGHLYSQKTSIHWKLWFFLHQLVPTLPGDPLGHKGTYSYNKLIFESCFGSYKQFIYDMTLEPAMLFYLNLQYSDKYTPDENYAREVQELFTVGKRPFAQYTEEDVRSMARLLVGWYCDYNAMVFEPGADPAVYFNSGNHDLGDKQFSEFYNNTLIQGRNGQFGKEELGEGIDMLFNTEEAAIYLCRRLYQYFVYPQTTEAIEEQIIRPLAQIMRDNNYSIVEPLKVLLSSEHFFDEVFRSSMIKPPLDYVMGMQKELNLFYGDMVYWDGSTETHFSENPSHPSFIKLQTQLSRSFYHFEYLGWVTGNQGMRINDPPSVSGWPAFYQTPVYDRFWINTSSLISRKQYTESRSQWGHYLTDGVNIRTNLNYYLNTFENPTDINALVDEFLGRNFTTDIEMSTRQRIIDYTLEGASPEHWQEYVGAFLQDPSISNENAIRQPINRLLSQLFELSEYQLY